MAITFIQLQELLKKENLNYYIAPDRPVARFGIAGNFGRYEIVVHLQDEGQFLQFRTVNYLFCSNGHPHLTALLQAISIVNSRRRLVKWGWESSDGEIIAYADHWIMDNQFTQQQLKRMLNNYLPGIDGAFQRLKATLDTGKDPGDPVPQTVPGQPSGGSAPPMPHALKDLLDKLQKKDGDKPLADKPPEPPAEPSAPEIKEI